MNENVFRMASGMVITPARGVASLDMSYLLLGRRTTALLDRFGIARVPVFEFETIEPCLSGFVTRWAGDVSGYLLNHAGMEIAANMYLKSGYLLLEVTAADANGSAVMVSRPAIHIHHQRDGTYLMTPSRVMLFHPGPGEVCTKPSCGLQLSAAENNGRLVDHGWAVTLMEQYAAGLVAVRDALHYVSAADSSYVVCEAAEGRMLRIADSSNGRVAIVRL